MTEHTISYQNSDIFYRTAGKGKMVVLIHGFAEDGDVWHNQIHFLQDYFYLVVPDLPGSGRSKLIPGANIETYAAVIKRIIDTENDNSSLKPASGATLIGHSMGGYISLAFAEKYPEYLDLLGLFHSSAFADDEEKKRTRAKGIEFIKNNGSAPFLKTSIPGLFTKEYNDSHPEEIRSLIDKGTNFTAEALIQYYEAMIERPDRTALLKRLSKPVLLIIGEHDTAIPLQISLQQSHLAAQSYVHILNSSAHMGMWEESGRSNRLLYDFIVDKF